MESDNDTARLEAFSDGVFSIAITLLAFNMKIPRPADLPPGGSLFRALVDQWPTYLAYLTSFFTILVMWINHHRLFRLIRRSNRALFAFNGLLLMFVTLVPYPTALLATYLFQPQAKAAVTVYIGTYFMIGICFNLLWRYASCRGHLLAEDVDQDQIDRLHTQYLSGLFFYVIALILSFWSVFLGFGLCMALAVFFLLRGVPSKRTAPA
jgi:uncharacterized membrane protein